MSLKLVVIFAAAVLASSQGAPMSLGLHNRLSQRLFQSCNPHLRLPNGSRMAVDLVSYYNEIDPKCLGGLVMATFNIQRNVKLFETKEDTAICHGFIELLSLIDAYNWTKEMCENESIADERGRFCETYSAKQKNIEILKQKYNLTGYKHLIAVSLLLSSMGEENCKEFCYGIMNSTLCSSFVDASSFFLTKFESDPPQEKIIIPEENTTKSLPSRTEFQVPRLPAENIPARVPAVPARPTADGASSDKDARELYLMMKKVLKEMQMEKAGSTLGTQDKPTTITATSPSIIQPDGENAVVDAAVPVSPTSLVPKASPTASSEAPTTEDTVAPSEGRSEEEPEDANTVLEEVLDKIMMTKEDLLDILGSDFHGNLNRMTAEEILDALEEAEDELLTPEDIAEFEAWEEEEEDALTDDVSEDEPQEAVTVSPKQQADEESPQEPVIEQKVDEIVKLGTTKVNELEKEVEEEVKSSSYGSWHFFTIILVLAVVVIGGYLCVHNRKRLREGVGSYLSDSKHRRKRTREYKPLMGQT